MRPLPLALALLAGLGLAAGCPAALDAASILPPRRRRPQPVSSTAGGTSPPMRARRGDWSVRRASTSPYGGLGVRRRGGVFLPPPGKAKPAKVLLMLLFDAYHRRGATVARGPL